MSRVRRPEYLKRLKYLLPGLAVSLFVSCVSRQAKSINEAGDDAVCDGLRDTLEAVVSGVPGEVGIAVIVDSRDTGVVNNSDGYPLMSVFKLHQAIALCADFDRRGIPLDTVVRIDRSSLDPDTWSPMLKENAGASFDMPVRELMRYTLALSDNNASNLMFDRFVSVAATDSFVARLIPREGFRLAVSEADMRRDHSLCYSNHSSPLSTALLFERLFADSILAPESQAFIRDALGGCATGVDRLTAPLAAKEGVAVAHKTGSGYRNGRGELAAHNDAAYVGLPDGRHYTIVVLVKDFAGDEREASAIISRVSELAYDFIAGCWKAD